MESSAQDPAVAATLPPQRLEPGATIDGFVLKRRIGSGGMGEVFEAVQPLIGKRVAIKVLREGAKKEAADASPVLVAEARAAASVRHRGIVDIYNLGELPDGRQYLVMELLEGHPVDRLLAETGPFPLQEGLDLLDELLEALEAVHAAGVLHRDLKPSNVFLVPPPSGTPYTKLLDFGLARAPDLAGPRSRLVSGTPPYLAPEQLRGEAATVVSDLFAFGAVAFELLTGRKAFPGEPSEVIAQQRSGLPNGGVADLPAAVAVLLLKLLSYDPAARPRSAREIQQQLRQMRSSLSEVASFELDRGFEEPAPAAPAAAPPIVTREVEAVATPGPPPEPPFAADALTPVIADVLSPVAAEVLTPVVADVLAPVAAEVLAPVAAEVLTPADAEVPAPATLAAPVTSEPPPEPSIGRKRPAAPLAIAELTLTPVGSRPPPPPAPTAPPVEAAPPPPAPAPAPAPASAGRLRRALSVIGKLFARTPAPPPPPARVRPQPPAPPLAALPASPLTIELDLDELELAEPTLAAALTPERLAELTEAVVEQLGKSPQLPAFPSAAGRILSLLASPDVDVAALVKIVSQDPVLTTQVMRMANSALLSRGNEIKTVRDAVTRLGLRDVAGAATAAATMALFDKQLQGAGPACTRLRRQFFTLSLATGFSAAWLAMEHRLGDSDQAFLAGLLHDLGKSMALTALADPATSKRLRLTPDSEELAPVLEAVHAELGGRMAELWALPEIVALVCREHHEPKPGPNVRRELHVVRLVAALAEMRHLQSWPRERLEEVRSSAAVLGLNRHQVRAASTQVAQLLERAKALVAAGG